jgi:hypothetical protein
VQDERKRAGIAIRGKRSDVWATAANIFSLDLNARAGDEFTRPH